MPRQILRIAAVCLLLAGCVQHGTAPDGDQCLCPAATLRLDSMSVLPGQMARVNLRMDLGHDAAQRLDSIGGLNLLIDYDTTALAFLGARSGPAISEWEYFTYRHSYGHPGSGVSAEVRILSIRDLDNGPDVHPSGQHLPEGALVVLDFYVTANRSMIGTCAPVQFVVLECSDNCLGSASRDRVFLPNLDIGTVLLGPDYDPNACRNEYRDDEVSAEPVLAFRAGSVCIKEPPDDGPITGDLNLNGVPFEVADVVIFADYLIHGESALDPDQRQRQERAGDIDGDARPLTQADWDMMMQIIEGGP